MAARDLPDFAASGAALPGDDPRPLVVHVVYRFAIGGLENGVVNLLNRLPADRFRHAVISLTDVTDFRQRVTRDDVAFFELHKPTGHGAKVFPALFRVFRRLRPAIVHTRNLAALEATFPAWLAGVPIRIHGEHGRDVDDLDGSNRKYRLVRRMHRPFVDQYVALSQDLVRYLIDAIGVSPAIVEHIVNGVDTSSFTPAPERAILPGSPFAGCDLWVFGTVGRLQAVKNQTHLARAFVRALAIEPGLRDSARLVIVGDGPLRADVQAILAEGKATGLAWLPGERNDVAEVMRALDVFVLPSRAEGISNTILEAMASGLPVLATDVGGNRELVVHETGMLVAPDDVDALANGLLYYARARTAAKAAGRAGRIRVERVHGLDGMAARYAALYERLLAGRIAPRGRQRERQTDRATIEGH
ncbi:MAG TPA: TIGR03088 family PEP-CTERM/XrtA system glycosyltransferase [Casimicrobiaceae bacterium]|nr:TIGR03088 family PEP-CTERM/XrtA system glycosyltransferase [Casimicrobiaceae bacterium]